MNATPPQIKEQIQAISDERLDYLLKWALYHGAPGQPITPADSYLEDYDEIYSVLTELRALRFALALRGLEATANEPGEAVAWDELARDQARGKAAKLLGAKGWKLGDSFSITATLALMVEFAEQAHTITDRCGYPDCGCDFDARCSHPAPQDGVPAPVASDEMVGRANE